MLWSFGKLLFLAVGDHPDPLLLRLHRLRRPGRRRHGGGPRDPDQHRDRRRRRLLPQLRDLGLHDHRADHGVGARCWSTSTTTAAREHNRLLVAGVAFLPRIALLIGALDRDLPQGVRPGHDGDDQGRPGRAPARQVRRRPDPRRPGRPGPRGRPGRRAGRDPGRARPGRRRGDPRQRRRSQILPTTLFGQKFISFVRPADPSARARSQDGDVIPADRVETNVELSQILADLFPLLRAVAAGRPQRDAQRAVHRARGPRRADRRDPRRARRLPRRDRRPPADAAQGPDLASPTSPTPTTWPRPTCSTCSQPHGDQPDGHREGATTSTSSSPTWPGSPTPRPGSSRDNERRT